MLKPKEWVGDPSLYSGRHPGTAQLFLFGSKSSIGEAKIILKLYLKDSHYVGLVSETVQQREMDSG